MFLGSPVPLSTGGIAMATPFWHGRPSTRFFFIICSACSTWRLRAWFNFTFTLSEQYLPSSYSGDSHWLTRTVSAAWALIRQLSPFDYDRQEKTIARFPTLPLIQAEREISASRFQAFPGNDWHIAHIFKDISRKVWAKQSFPEMPENVGFFRQCLGSQVCNIY